MYGVYLHVRVERGYGCGCWWKEGVEVESVHLAGEVWGAEVASVVRWKVCGGGENFVWMSALDTQTKLGMSLDDLAARAGGGGRLIQSGIVGKRSFRRSVPYKMYQPRESSGYGQRLGQSRWFIPPTSFPCRWTNKECLLEDKRKKNLHGCFHQRKNVSYVSLSSIGWHIVLEVGNPKIVMETWRHRGQVENWLGVTMRVWFMETHCDSI